MKIITKHQDAIHDVLLLIGMITIAAGILWMILMVAFGINRTYEIDKVEYGRYLQKQEENRVVIEIGSPVYELATLEK